MLIQHGMVYIGQKKKEKNNLNEKRNYTLNIQKNIQTEN